MTSPRRMRTRRNVHESRIEIALQRDEWHEPDRELSSPMFDRVYRREEAQNQHYAGRDITDEAMHDARERINFRVRFSISGRAHGTGLFTRNRL